jgi:ferredoxin-NADP reductase/Na+-translocating ferredoxin:NAD+ oxidoreductase RnfD subunit
MTSTISSAIAHLGALPNRLTNKIGMYRLVTLSLLAILVCSLAASATGLLYYSVQAQLTTLLLAVGIALGANIVCAKFWRVHANHESALITGLILFFLVSPQVAVGESVMLMAAVAIAIISKYIVTYRRQHIFNAAAVGAVSVTAGVWLYNAMSGATYNTDIFGWWVSNPILVWPVLITGILITAKIRRFAVVTAFIATGLLVYLLESIRFEQPLWDSTLVYFFSYPTLFLAFFMLTEPFTMPPRKGQQVAYGAVVGGLSSTVLFAPFLAMTPELALVMGNMFAYCFRSRRKLFIKLQSKQLIADNTWEFTFNKPDNFTFVPGQYVEWMLPHEKKDSRGPRRYFTIASSPTEAVIRLALKVVPVDSDMRGSSYKQALLELDEAQEIIVSQLAGDFVLPADTTTKLGFIAGGIGITPFSSQLSWMQGSGQHYNTRLYYCCNTVEEMAYLDTFECLGETLPIVTIPVIAKQQVQPPKEQGYLTAEMLARRTPDFKERTWYISGPPGMVNAYKKVLRDAGVSRKQIHTDFFPGLA